MLFQNGKLDQLHILFVNSFFLAKMLILDRPLIFKLILQILTFSSSRLK